jgi:hypothetical protein
MIQGPIRVGRAVFLLFALVGAVACDRERPPSKTDSVAKTASQPRAAANEKLDTAPKSDHEAQLAELGYLTWSSVASKDRSKSGVTHHDPTKAHPGINVFCSENSSTVQFVEMDGKVIHRVEVPTSDVWRETNKCKMVAFADNGTLVMVVENTEIIKADLEGKVLWRRNGRYHHDVDVTPDGQVHAILGVSKPAPKEYQPAKRILDDVFVTLTSQGRITRRLSLAEMVMKKPKLLKRVVEQIGKKRSRPKLKERELGVDLFHTNTIDVIRERVQARADLVFEKGDILFCSRYLDLFGVIDVEEHEIRWHWGTNEMQWPHHSTLMPNGQIMVFDNGVRRKSSRVITVDIGNSEIVGMYRADPPKSLYALTRGGAQPLPNGNTLISDSPKGRVFEVTPKGKTAWEFYNPDMSENGDARATIYRMQRLDPEQHIWLRQLRTATAGSSRGRMR